MIRLASPTRPKPVRVTVDGARYYLNREPAARYHAQNSMDKLVRMVDLIDSANCVFDVGANCGIFSALCARRFPTATVHAFEPSPALQPVLAHNCSASNISIHQVAVGEDTQPVTLYINPDSQQTNSLALAAVQPFARSVETETVQCVTLDGFIPQHGPPDVLKIDVQGYEGAVIRGAQTVLPSVRYLFIESSWLDPAGQLQVLPAAAHYGFTDVAVVNPVHAGADLLLTRQPLPTEIPGLLRFTISDITTGKSWLS